MSQWTFVQLFPLRHPRAIENAAALGGRTLGVEVTEPELARQCGLGNIDPQHSGGGLIECAAIDLALEWPLPPVGSILATLRPDSDALGAMALFVLRARDVPMGDEIRGRVQEISRWDRFDQGGWAAWRITNPPLPSLARMADLGGLPLSIKAVRAVALDQSLPLDGRVSLIASWLETGCPPHSGLAQTTAFEQQFVEDWNSGRLRIELDGDPRLALVSAPGPAGLQAGYRIAPVVAAQALVPGGRKLTLAQFERGWIDMPAALDELRAMEAGWGGSATLIASPQGTGSTLSLGQLAGVARKYLCKAR